MHTNPKMILIAPSYFKIGASLVYEAFVIIGLTFVFASVFIFLVGDATQGIKRYMLQIFLLITLGFYFVWSWSKSGQTLSMQAWKLKLVDSNGHLLLLNRAILRYLLACIGFTLFGIGFLWIFVDRDRLFLHDRFLKNKIIYFPSS